MHAPATIWEVPPLAKDRNPNLTSRFTGGFVLGNQGEFALLRLSLTLHKPHARHIVQPCPAIRQIQGNVIAPHPS